MTTTSYDAAYAEVMEWVADLQWPTSVWTYSQMRTDPQLRSILQAYSLPLRRASWSVDPTGCRPEVAAFVADNLGLTVLGDDSTRPRRGPIRFATINRLAMLHLVFGHMPFEKVYDTSDGETARLARIDERMPHTIDTIQLDAQDDLVGILQSPRAGGTVRPIPRKDLVWFAHEREGGAWQGRSLLRDSYGAWLIKRELWRSNATSHRRNGMGVPVVTAPPGATPAQVTEAQRLASAHRVGDTAGVGLPAGFLMELKGITGSLPDTLGFIQYLDQQMTRSALAGVVDLGATPNGSRALGDTFVDLLMLGLQAIGDDVADTWTADVAVELVALNFGEDEPVPSIVCGDVGESHEVTATTLQALLGSGALSTDPELEAYVRQQWKLPAKPVEPEPETEPEPEAPADETPEPETEPETEDETEDETPTPVPPALAPVAAAAADPAKEWPFRRQLTAVEARALVDPVELDKQHTAGVDALLAAWQSTYEPMVRAAILAAVEAGYTDGVEALTQITVDTPPELIAAMVAQVTTAAEQAAAEQAREAQGQGATADPEAPLDTTGIAAFAGAMAQLLVRSMVTTATKKAVQAATSARSVEDVTTAVDDALTSLTEAQPKDTFSAAVAYGQGQGRSAVLATAPAGTYVASEVMDDATCDACAAIDGHVFASRDEADAAYASGGYSDCQGGLRCRGIVVTTWD